MFALLIILLVNTINLYDLYAISCMLFTKHDIHCMVKQEIDKHVVYI